MKKLLLILLCLPMIGFGQDITDRFPNEEAIKVYLSDSSVSHLEGIYEYNSAGFALMYEGSHRLALVFSNGKYIFLGIDKISKEVFSKKG